MESHPVSTAPEEKEPRYSVTVKKNGSTLFPEDSDGLERPIAEAMGCFRNSMCEYSRVRGLPTPDGIVDTILIQHCTKLFSRYADSSTHQAWLRLALPQISLHRR